MSTNPLFLTNREAALSPKGSSEIEAVCSFLERSQIDPSVIKYSFAASSMDSAKIVADRLHVGQNQVVPEFNFMDPRAIGKWDMMPISQVLPAIIAMDDLQATKDGTGGRPPPNDDGTPNETLEDNSIRLAQLMAGMLTYILLYRRRKFVCLFVFIGFIPYSHFGFTQSHGNTICGR